MERNLIFDVSNNQKCKWAVAKLITDLMFHQVIFSSGLNARLQHQKEETHVYSSVKVKRFFFQIRHFCLLGSLSPTLLQQACEGTAKVNWAAWLYSHWMLWWFYHVGQIIMEYTFFPHHCKQFCSDILIHYPPCNVVTFDSIIIAMWASNRRMRVFKRVVRICPQRLGVEVKSPFIVHDFWGFKCWLFCAWATEIELWSV